MKMTRLFAGGLIALIMALMPSIPAAAAPSPTIKSAQTIINKFGIPVGPIDGLNGPNTAQGYCAFRYIAGLTPSRAPLNTALWNALTTYNSRYTTGHDIPRRLGPNGNGTYLVVDQTCQMMFVYVNGGTLWAVFPTSTGKPGLETPNGIYALGATVKGWTCSTIYPTNCTINRTQGMYSNLPGRNYGNMYNKRSFKAGGFYVHGSLTVPTYPGSAGCIRIPISSADWLATNIPNGTPLVVRGSY